MDTNPNNHLINRLFCFSFEILKASVPKKSDDQKVAVQHLRECLSRAPESRSAFIAPIPGLRARKARCSPFCSRLRKRILGFFESAPFLLLPHLRARARRTSKFKVRQLPQIPGRTPGLETDGGPTDATYAKKADNIELVVTNSILVF